MGWGLLFIGYVLSFVLGLNPLFSLVTALPGAAFMLAGLVRLDRYCHTFRLPAIALALPSALWIAKLVGGILSAAGMTAEATERLQAAAAYGSSGPVMWLEAVAILLFHVALAVAVRELAERVDLKKNAVNAWRNTLMVVLWGITLVLAETVPSATTILPAVSMIVRLAWTLCNTILLFSCYMRITPAEQTEPVRRPSRIGWVNRLRDRYDEKTEKAISADRAYHAENARKRQEARLSRMSKKQQAREEARKHRRK